LFQSPWFIGLVLNFVKRLVKRLIIWWVAQFSWQPAVGLIFFHFCIGFSLTHLAGPLVQNNHRMQTRASANQNITHHQLCPRPRQAAPPGAMNSRGAEQPWWLNLSRKKETWWRSRLAWAGQNGCVFWSYRYSWSIIIVTLRTEWKATFYSQERPAN
jgi:hypothetical protein